MTESPWFPFFYQFIIGGAVFILGIALALRKGAISMSVRKDRRTIFQLIVGYLALAAFYAVMIFSAGV
ncbi:MAG: hypothetical protein CVV44_01980 [Spirochaetae bacterium HGW-Spirochaetae-1]|jgi:hypothetical protein|nr:MAG: hypothetical protein CVV44_01980 [Spirochaetae bacterium HGW-Spirochaetae-1]